jgi:hypothetical protein
MIRVPNNTSPGLTERDKAPSGFNHNMNYDLQNIMLKEREMKEQKQ